jgi:hypothetical protein
VNEKTSDSADQPASNHSADPEIGRIRDLIAEVDSCALDAQWDEIVAIRDRCVAAVQRGHQWWPAAAWAEYRLALDAPGSFAATVLDSAAARFTLGPFTEVAASTHSWDELAPHLDRSPTASLFAHECIARGDDLCTDNTYLDLPALFDLPAALQPWEPSYGPVVYHLDRVEHHAPLLRGEPFQASDLKTSTVELTDDVDLSEALRSFVRPWEQDPGWRVRSDAFQGAAVDVVHALNVQAGSVQRLDPALGLSYLAWVGATGGPNGRRRGLASSRNDLWWVLLHLTGIIDSDNLGAVQVADASSEMLDDLADGIAELQWWTWADAPNQRNQPNRTRGTAERTATDSGLDGWRVNLIVEAPLENLAWSLVAAPHRPSSQAGSR